MTIVMHVGKKQHAVCWSKVRQPEKVKKKKSFLLSCQYPRNKITADKVKVNIGHEIT